MALSKEQLLSLARHGAQARIAELRAEIAQIEREFGRNNSRSVPAVKHRRRGRSSMSAAQRKAVSARMKKYWAGRRGAKKKN